jgi:hypothetical protein
MQQSNFDFDFVYKEKLRLSQIANYINELSNNKSQVLIENSESNSYTGTYNKSFDNLNLVGLKEGIRRIFEAH